MLLWVSFLSCTSSLVLLKCLVGPVLPTHVLDMFSWTILFSSSSFFWSGSSWSSSRAFLKFALNLLRFVTFDPATHVASFAPFHPRPKSPSPWVLVPPKGSFCPSQGSLLFWSRSFPEPRGVVPHGPFRVLPSIFAPNLGVGHTGICGPFSWPKGQLRMFSWRRTQIRTMSSWPAGKAPWRASSGFRALYKVVLYATDS